MLEKETLGKLDKSFWQCQESSMSNILHPFVRPVLVCLELSKLIFLALKSLKGLSGVSGGA